LLADDDAELCDLLADYLHGEGFEVEAVHDGTAAVRAARAGSFDVLVLDVMMPGQNGFEALRELRAGSPLPVLMLTARGDDVDRIVGLEMGADDYLAKPCNPREFAARLRAILRRAHPASVPVREESGPIRVGGVTLDPRRRTVAREGDPVDLTSTEFDVLETLLRRAGEVVTKATLTENALGRELTRHDRAIDMHVSNVRRKLGPAGDGGQRIKTVRRVGYLYPA